MIQRVTRHNPVLHTQFLYTEEIIQLAINLIIAVNPCVLISIHSQLEVSDTDRMSNKARRIKYVSESIKSWDELGARGDIYRLRRPRANGKFKLTTHVSPSRNGGC